MNSKTRKLAGLAAGTVVSLALAGAALTGITPTAQAQTHCQWSYEAGRKVVVFGDNIEAWRIDLRTQSAMTIDVPNTTGRTSVKVTLPTRFAEDDVQEVSCKVGGTWYRAGTA